MMKSSLIRINLIFTLFVLFIPNLVSAESKTFIKEYTYQASEFDSKASCRTIALEQVKRLLLEELGTYLESNTEVKNYELTKDKITALTAGIVQTEIVDEKWDGQTYWIKTRIVADPNDVIKSIDNLRKDRDKSRELEDTKKRSDAILEENKKLREELALAKGSAKQQVQQEYDNSIKELSAIEWYVNGLRVLNEGDFEQALQCFNQAIQLNYADAYYSRAAVYTKQAQYKKAIKDYTKLIEL